MFYEMAEDAKSGEGPPDTKEAEALVSALNHSAERVQTLWFSFLTFMVYLAIATGTTTHRMLFLESPLNLPVLNIALPLLGFYILTPIIFVTFHFYMLLNLVLLARTAKSFEDSLAHAFPDDGELRETFRMRIENTLFVQLLVGAKLEREGLNAKLLSLMALITLAVAPVALLLMIQIKFLPYHSEWITWLHRGLLAIDLLFVWTLWPGYRSGWGVRLWPNAASNLAWSILLSTAALAYAVLIATFPDERMYSATSWLRESHFAANARAKISPINTLDVHGEDLIDDTKLANIEKNESMNGQRWEPTLPLTRRDLTGANLSNADIRHVDFSGALLNRAYLDHAWAKNAHFNCLENPMLPSVCAQLQGTSLQGAQLQGAALEGAWLQGASLIGAQLQGALLNKAQLQGIRVGTADWFSSESATQLQGASLNEAQLQGVNLTNVQLQAASLDKVQLQGASLDGAHLQGAFLRQAQLQGASLVGAQLQDAWLDDAQLQGADLSYAHLQGTWLERAQLQGVTFRTAQFQGAWLKDVFVWRADVLEVDWKGAHVAGPKTGPKKSCYNFNSMPQIVDPDADPSSADPYKACDWRAEDSENLKRLIAEQIPEGEQRDDAVERIGQKLDPNTALDREKEMAREWTKHNQSFRDVPRQNAAGQWVKSLAELWLETGCAAAGAPYVVRALLARVPADLFRNNVDVSKAAAAFLDKEHCPGARGLSDDEIAKLKGFVIRAPPLASKP